jgi:hypothetical protein
VASCVASGLPFGSRKVTADITWVITVPCIGSMIRAVSAFTMTDREGCSGAAVEEMVDVVLA